MIVNISSVLTPLVISTLLGASEDPVRDTLQATADFWFRGILVSSALVAVGVVLEAPESTITLKRWFKLKRGKQVPEPNERSWAVPASYLGLLLVVLGVGGEGIFESLVSNADTSLRAHESQVLADTRLRTAQAELDAADARNETAQLSKDTQGLRTEADKQRRIAMGAKQKAEEAHAIAEREKLDEAQLELLVGPRRLTLDEQEKIGKSCNGMNHNRVSVSSYGMDSEGKALGSQIAYAIYDHTFSVNIEPGGPVTSAGFDEGIFINGPPETAPFTQCLADALTNIGRLRDVKVSEKRRVGTGMGGNATMGGAATMGGGATTQATLTLSAGSPISIFVGVKPVELLQLKK